MTSSLLRTVSSALIVLALAACASVPVDDSVGVPSQVAMRGSKGPLSARETRRILSRVDAQAPDATALERHLAIEQSVARTPLYTGNATRILNDGPETFGEMFAAIRNARRYVLLEYYIFEEVSVGGQSLSDLLIEKQKSGVEVCIIYDSIGSMSTPGDFFGRLRDAGIKIAEFNSPNPIRGGNPFAINDRDHRKILVSDGTTAIIGGVNLSHTYESAPGRGPSGSGSSGGGSSSTKPDDEPPETWHDTDLELSGPVVRELELLYRAQWDALHATTAVSKPTTQIDEAGDEVVRIVGSDPSSRRPPFYTTVISAIRSAETRIWITAAYFGPTFQQMHALLEAARRGVDVRILVPSHSDSAPALAVQHSHYAALLRNHVRVFEWTDGILHTKAATVDGVWSITGSSNFDQRSVLYNDEVDAVVLGRNTAARYEGLFTGHAARSKEITQAEWGRRSLTERAREHFWRLLQRLL